MMFGIRNLLLVLVIISLIRPSLQSGQNSSALNDKFEESVELLTEFVRQRKLEQCATKPDAFYRTCRVALAENRLHTSLGAMGCFSENLSQLSKVFYSHSSRVCRQARKNNRDLADLAKSLNVQTAESRGNAERQIYYLVVSKLLSAIEFTDEERALIAHRALGYNERKTLSRLIKRNSVASSSGSNSDFDISLEDLELGLKADTVPFVVVERHKERPAPKLPAKDQDKDDGHCSSSQLLEPKKDLCNNVVNRGIFETLKLKWKTELLPSISNEHIILLSIITFALYVIFSFDTSALDM